MFSRNRNPILPVLLLVCAWIAACGGSSSSNTMPLSAAGTTLANGQVGTAYNSSLTATGGTAPYTWFEVSGGVLPTGLLLSGNGTITGTPVSAGTYGPYVFLATDSKRATSATGNLSFIITEAGAVAVTTTVLADGSVGTAYSLSLMASGGTAPYSWAVTSGGALPAGLTLSTDGTLAGTPTASGTYGPYVFTVTDASNATAASVSLTLKIDAAVAQCVSQGNESALNRATPYGFLLKGTDGSGNPIDVAGSFTPNGAGGISAANVDYNGYSSIFINGATQLSVNLAKSNYSFASSASQGCLYLAFNGQTGTGLPLTAGFQFVLGQSLSSVYQSGRIIASDSAISDTRAAGFMYIQNTATFDVTLLQSNYAFGVDGWTTPNGTNLLRAAIAGTFTNTGGTLSNGFADTDEGGTPSGELTGGSGVINPTFDIKTGRGTGTYSTPSPSGTLTFNFVIYLLNTSDFILMSTDQTAFSPLLAGRALAASATYPADPLNGSYLYATEGYDSNAGGNFLQIGNLTATNNGAITTATVFFNDAGTSGSNLYQNLSYTVEAASGRGVASGFGAAPPVAYLTAPGSDDNIVAFVVGTDAQSSSGLLVNQTTGIPAYSLASLNGNYAGGTNEDMDGKNGAYLASFGFSGAGTYTIGSPLTTGTVAVVPSLGTYTINADGSGTLDGSNFTFVTSGTEIFAIPNSGDPLLFVFLQGATPQ
jgi:hypothetical protein